LWLRWKRNLDDDSETIITNERYEYISKLTANCLHKKRRALSTSDKIDRVVTNRWLALPIFAGASCG
jgi:ferrous iron transport protein B